MDKPADRKELIALGDKAYVASWDQHLGKDGMLAALSAIEAAGCHVSPNEPSLGMVDAAQGNIVYLDQWRDMTAASPFNKED